MNSREIFLPNSVSVLEKRRNFPRILIHNIARRSATQSVLYMHVSSLHSHRIRFSESQHLEKSIFFSLCIFILDERQHATFTSLWKRRYTQAVLAVWSKSAQILLSVGWHRQVWTYMTHFNIIYMTICVLTRFQSFLNFSYKDKSPFWMNRGELFEIFFARVSSVLCFSVSACLVTWGKWFYIISWQTTPLNFVRLFELMQAGMQFPCF